MRIRHLNKRASVEVQPNVEVYQLVTEMLRRGYVFHYDDTPLLLAIHSKTGLPLGNEVLEDARRLTEAFECLVSSTFGSTEPVIGSCVQHFKGGLYTVKDIATACYSPHPKTVIYEDRTASLRVTWARELASWNELVQRPNGARAPRFMTCESVVFTEERALL